MDEEEGDDNCTEDCVSCSCTFVELCAVSVTFKFEEAYTPSDTIPSSHRTEKKRREQKKTETYIIHKQPKLDTQPKPNDHSEKRHHLYSTMHIYISSCTHGQRTNGEEQHNDNGHNNAMRFLIVINGLDLPTDNSSTALV